MVTLRSIGTSEGAWSLTDDNSTMARLSRSASSGLLDGHARALWRPLGVAEWISDPDLVGVHGPPWQPAVEVAACGQAPEVRPDLSGVDRGASTVAEQVVGQRRVVVVPGGAEGHLHRTGPGRAGCGGRHRTVRLGRIRRAGAVGRQGCYCRADQTLLGDAVD